jgi:hypothetical protein
MKKHLKRHSFLLLPLVLSLPLTAGIARAAATSPTTSPATSPATLVAHPLLHRASEDEVTKRRLINKSYTVTTEDKLDIDNKFGDVMVSTWDKDQITVDIEITATGSTDEKATALMNQIDVKDAQKDKTISFKTSAGDIQDGDGEHKHKGKEKTSKRFSINYVIHMPAANPLTVKNEFGKIVVPDMQGAVNLVSKFGGLTAGKLGNVEAIDVEFGSASIAEIGNGKLTLKFDGESSIKKIGGDVKIGIEFSGRIQLGLGEDIADLVVSESYSEVRMIAAKDLSAEFAIHTSFGDFHDETGSGLKERKTADSDVGPRFDKDFEGRTGDGKAKITVKSSFGSILLTHDWHGTTT